jgi:quercetin dioxygenase-like cupin family protein
MQTTAQAVEDRIARYQDLKVLRHIANSDMPQEALDLLYARTILPVITPETGDTVVAAGGAISGAGGLTMGFAICPPGQGPGLHVHAKTYETFVVLEGEYEFSWGSNGEHSAVLGKYDTISIPPGEYRAFRATGTEDAVILALINGADQNDITQAAVLGDELATLGSRTAAEQLGFRFASE